MTIKTIVTDKATGAIGPYVQGNIAGDFLFASGQIPLDPATGEIVGKTITEQTDQVMKNISGLLAAAETDFAHVIKTTCFLSDMENFVPFNTAYAKAFGTSFPARSAVEVARLPKDVLVEVEIIAYLGK